MKKVYSYQLLSLIFFAIAFSNLLFAQEEEFELFLIDNYLKDDNQNVLVLSWNTNIECRSTVIIKEFGKFKASDTLTKIHSTEIDVSKYPRRGEEVEFWIVSTFEDGLIDTSETFTFYLPPIEDVKIESDRTSFLINTCCIGGSLWLIPSPGISIIDGDLKFSISKEFPLISFGSESAYKNYPYGYLSVEFTHNLKSDVKNLFRYGYKHIFEINDFVNFVSVGLSGFSNFKGLNGISPEMTISIFKVLSSFDFYLRYRYDNQINSGYKSQNILIGLFTSSFSLHLNF
ncbi:MAG: hypothetical protein N3A61_08590 [Ignavibacteria bacterium]|nr:hypothetical protein [Ignavibacteria bacterium]